MKEYSIENIMDAFNECAKQLEEKDKEIERLNNIIQTKDEGFKATTEELCETAEENGNLKEVIETLKRTNLLLIKQKAESEDNLYMLDNRIDKAIEYIEDRFFINEETGEYCLTHTFDGGNLYELMKILKENKQ